MKNPLLVAMLALCTLRAQDFSDVLPIVKTLPAPPSVQEGVRLSYYGSVGDIPDSDYDKWSSEDGNWEYNTAPSGHGYTQVDVVAVSGLVAALSVQTWQYSDWTGPLIPIRGGQSGLVCHAGGGDWWIHPQALSQVQEVQSEDFAIVRVSQIIDGAVHPAIRIQRTLPGSRQAVVYDLQTGLLLFKNAAVRTEKTTFASQMFYKGSRVLPFAGGARPLPAWIRPGLALDYQGTFTANVIGNPPFSLPLEALVQVQSVGDRWFSYEQTTILYSISGLPPTVTQATLVGGGNLYIAPEILQGFQAGAVLDTDPITGARLTVTEKGATVALRSIVGTVSYSELRYEAASGLMTGVRLWDCTSPLYSEQSQLDLTQMPDLSGPPRLVIRRETGQIALSGEDLGTRSYTIESSEDGEAWREVGQLNAGQSWKCDINTSRRITLFRLRQ
jgi:hypothetical protein